MNKENNAVVIPTTAGTGGELSAEQRARISQSFRAAKTLLSRKRPSFDSATASGIQNSCSSGDERATKYLVRADEIQRLPLSQINTNSSSLVSLNGCKLFKKNGDDAKNGFKSETLLTAVMQAGCNVNPCSRDASSCNNQLNGEGFGVQKAGLSLEDGSILDPCYTPLRQQDGSYECESSSNSNSIKPLVFPDMNVSGSTSNFLGDDYDESIFEQIDALCERKSSQNSEKEDCAMNRMENDFVTKSCEEDITIENVSDETLKSEEILDSVGDEACEVKGLGKSETNLTKNMPEEYSKYIQSLNDKQQEAACSDVSTPLLIVAGPGSGKTSTMVGRVLVLLYEGISPLNILAMTFTTAAAAEMRERIGAVAGKAAAKELTISTFHSFSLQLCRSHAEKLGRTPDFLIYGQGQQRKAVIEAVRLLEDGKRRTNQELGKLTEFSDINSPKHFKDKSKKWLKFVTQAKAAGRSPEDFHKIGEETGEKI